MSKTLTYTRKLPEDGDRGSSFFNDLEHNITVNDAHDHDGVNSVKIGSTNVVTATQDINSGDWGADSGGSTFTQTVTMPAGVEFDNHVISFKDKSDGALVFPTVLKTGASTYSISVNDNTMNILAYYG